MAADGRVLTREEFATAARPRFGDDRMLWARRCPACGDVATPADFGEMYIYAGLVCLRRLDERGGCDFVLPGVLVGEPVAVPREPVWTLVQPDGERVSVFPLAEVAT